ncbi:DUF2935 domain-containing protein [Paenibacillus chartarius]|uniref:DUF2935 domain-containing protein n=1 Tax=Paenibacillus chartarius TaxID=747481 RepID=A0ABV6DSQ0_9BACL
MLMVYGALMPLRVLEEIRFWKMQEREHTVVIRTLVPDLETPFVRLLEEWEGVFEKAEMAAVRLIEAAIRSGFWLPPQQQAQVNQLLIASASQSRLFIQHLMRMEQESVPIRTRPVVKTVLEHIIRESEYFLGVLQAGDPMLGLHAPPVPAGVSYTPSNMQELAYLHVQPSARA